VREQEIENEFSLVRQAQAGDEKAFEQLVKRHDRHVLNIALGMTGQLVDAQDIYQESFLRAFSKLQTFSFQSSFKTWLLRIVVNQSINYRRKKKLRTFLSIDSSDESTLALPELTDHSDPTRKLTADECRSLIGKALKKLSAKERAVFTLKHEQDYKIREIAVILDCAEGTVKNMLFRAVNKLQKALRNYIQE